MVRSSTTRRSRSRGQLLVAEPEALEGLQQPAGAGDHAVPATVRQPPGEHLEHAASRGGAAAQRGLEHGELVVVGEQCRAGVLGARVTRQPKVVPCPSTVSIAPVEQESVSTDEPTEVDVPWITLVWNDPVNLMSYVTFVFQSYFGYSKAKAERLMMDVHVKGRAVVSTGTRERMETDTEALQGYGLWATFQKDS